VQVSGAEVFFTGLASKAGQTGQAIVEIRCRGKERLAAEKGVGPIQGPGHAGRLVVEVVTLPPRVQARTPIRSECPYNGEGGRMKPQQIEAWALRVIDQLEKKQNVEDALVELKSDWPSDLNKAARRLGGHANAARGEPVLWLIGVEEKASKVVGASFSEFANWYPAVEKEFDGVAPRCTPVNIPHRDGTVVALLVETDRMPYVVRNAVHGLQGGGAVSFEVPWRNGSRTDSARRAELVKLLIPATKLPEVEVLAAGLWAHELKPALPRPACIVWRLDVYLFITPRGDNVGMSVASRNGTSTSRV
jgi:hypothetical protein